MTGLDIRMPMGLMFTIFGAILSIYGLFSDPAIYAKHSLGVNINLDWGLCVFGFGLVMLLLSISGRKKAK